MRTFTHLLIVATLCVGSAFSEEDSKDLKAADVPAPVMATMVKAAAGAALKEFEQETKNGKAVYTAEFKDAAGKQQEVTVAVDGTLISVAPEGDEKDEGDKKGENEHEHEGHEHGQHK